MYCTVHINLFSSTSKAILYVDAGGVSTLTMTMSTDSADIKSKQDPSLLA